MTTEIVVPTLGESVTEATVAKWFKSAGDTVELDEPLVELETDKVTVEVPAPAAGVIADIVAEEGSDVEVGAILGSIDEDGGGAQKPKGESAPKQRKAEASGAGDGGAAAETPARKEAAQKGEAKQEQREQKPAPAKPVPTQVTMQTLPPAARKLIIENRLDPEQIPASGKDGRLTKSDVVEYLETHGKGGAVIEEKGPSPADEAPPQAAEPGPREERVRMTRLRRMVAQRLKDAQNTAAMLTTFNEVDMTAANALRNQYRDAFEKRHGVRLGVMSVFVKACVVALREFAAVNAEIDGEDIVYKNHYDIAIAVSSPNGLVVPVVRDADRLSFAAIEKAIGTFAKRARDGKLGVEDMHGGTFTITNGGVFGSLMSTPILNPPQSAILGMHKIQQRPMVMDDGRIEARPMMYVALSYDHRIIDGREAVSFLVRVKECVEDPQRILIES
jgi:2-oxoglutarate dehydrogenase E2 component (dihydrolipoamide succinyltransferase)